MSWYIPKHHITFSIWGTTMCSKCSMNLRVNWVLPHPEGPLTMDENGCRHDGSILQNEDESGLKVILIFKNFIYTNCFQQKVYLQIICTKLYLHSGRGFLANLVMSVSKGVFKVLKISFIIVRRQGSLYDVCGVDELFHASQGVKVCFCWLFLLGTISIMSMEDMLSPVRSFHPFGRFLFLVVG